MRARNTTGGTPPKFHPAAMADAAPADHGRSAPALESDRNILKRSRPSLFEPLQPLFAALQRLGVAL